MTHTWPSCTETGWCTTTFVLFMTRRWFTRIKLLVVCHLFMGWLTRARTTEHSIFGDFHGDPAASSLTPFVSHLYNVVFDAGPTFYKCYTNVLCLLTHGYIYSGQYSLYWCRCQYRHYTLHTVVYWADHYRSLWSVLPPAMPELGSTFPLLVQLPNDIL